MGLGREWAVAAGVVGAVEGAWWRGRRCAGSRPLHDPCASASGRRIRQTALGSSRGRRGTAAIRRAPRSGSSTGRTAAEARDRCPPAAPCLSVRPRSWRHTACARATMRLRTSPKTRRAPRQVRAEDRSGRQLHASETVSCSENRAVLTPVDVGCAADSLGAWEGQRRPLARALTISVPSCWSTAAVPSTAPPWRPMYPLAMTRRSSGAVY